LDQQDESMRRNLVFAGLGILLGLAMVAIYFAAQPYTLRGSVIEPPAPAPEIALTTSTGKSFTLDQDRGQITLVFFGYTSCPDVCPATLSQLRQVMTGLGGQQNAVKVLLVTVDPKRDTPESLGRYLSVFGANFTGLSGSQEQLEAVWKSYGVYRAIRPLSDNPDNYTVDHSARLYLIDRQGRLRLTYAYGTSSDDILQDIKYLLKEG
jgi:protein SCO1/2